MHFTILGLSAFVSPFILTATVWSIWQESRACRLRLRLLPPERRPPSREAWSFWQSSISRRQADRNSHTNPLWTSRGCQLELLTEGTIHAFEANASSYRPDRKARNRPLLRISTRNPPDRAEGLERVRGLNERRPKLQPAH
jgi:hypothetical protein